MSDHVWSCLRALCNELQWQVKFLNIPINTKICNISNISDRVWSCLIMSVRALCNELQCSGRSPNWAREFRHAYEKRALRNVLQWQVTKLRARSTMTNELQWQVTKMRAWFSPFLWKARAPQCAAVAVSDHVWSCLIMSDRVWSFMITSF
jgi:hypothetical protein